MKSIFEESFLVDSNILVYLLDVGSPYHRVVSDLFDVCDRRQVMVYAAQQNVTELFIALVRDYKLHYKDATHKVGLLLQNPSLRLITPLPTTLHTFLNLVSKLAIRDVFDLYLAATALDNGVEHIVTNNTKDFAGVPGLKVWGLKEVNKIISEHE